MNLYRKAIVHTQFKRFVYSCSLRVGGTQFSDPLWGSYWSRTGKMKFHNSEEVSVFAGHFVAQVAVLAAGYGRALILEDGVMLHNDPLQDPSTRPKPPTKNLRAPSLQQLPVDWEVVFFGWCQEFCHDIELISSGLFKPVHPLCPHAFGVTRKGARKLLMEFMQFPKIADHAIATAVAAGAIDAFATVPPLLDQLVFGGNRDKPYNLNERRHDYCQHHFLHATFTSLASLEESGAKALDGGYAHIAEYAKLLPAMKAATIVLPHAPQVYLNYATIQVLAQESIEASIHDTIRAINASSSSANMARFGQMTAEKSEAYADTETAARRNLLLLLAGARSAMRRFYKRNAGGKDLSSDQVNRAFEHFAGREHIIFAKLAKKFHSQPRWHFSDFQDVPLSKVPRVISTRSPQNEKLVTNVCTTTKDDKDQNSDRPITLAIQQPFCQDTPQARSYLNCTWLTQQVRIPGTKNIHDSSRSSDQIQASVLTK